MINKEQGRRVDTIFVLMIFCVFAAMVLMVLMLSGKIYKSMTDLSREGDNDRTCLSYIWSSVKNEDEAGRVRVEAYWERNALCFDEEFDGALYQTMIYSHGGWVHELFFDKDLELMPDDGVPVIEAEAFELKQLDNGLISVTTNAGSLLIYPRAQKGIPFNKE